MTLLDFLNPIPWIYHFFVVSIMSADIFLILLLNMKRTKPPEPETQEQDSFPTWNELHFERTQEKTETMKERLSEMLSRNEMIMFVLSLNVFILFYEFIFNIYTLSVFVAIVSAYIYVTKGNGLKSLAAMGQNVLMISINWIKSKITAMILRPQ